MFGIDGSNLLGGAILLFIGIALLKGFDRIAGRGPGQIKDGINRSKIIKNRSEIIKNDEQRIPCPQCSEKILPTAKKCPFCRSDL